MPGTRCSGTQNKLEHLVSRSKKSAYVHIHVHPFILFVRDTCIVTNRTSLVIYWYMSQLKLDHTKTNVIRHLNKRANTLRHISSLVKGTITHYRGTNIVQVHQEHSRRFTVCTEADSSETTERCQCTLI